MKIIPCTIIALWLVFPTLTSGTEIRYAYDSAGRMSMAEYSCVSLSYSYDTVGNILTKNIAIDNDNKGDIDNNGVVDLLDAILTLQVVAGIAPAKMVHLSCEVDNDSKVGLSEAIFIMQKVAGGVE
jgi:hypothetical protein